MNPRIDTAEDAPRPLHFCTPLTGPGMGGNKVGNSFSNINKSNSKN